MTDSEEEVEELMVFADFKKHLLVNQITDPNTKFTIIGIDSEAPIAELNGNIFKGQYDHAIGTIVCFEKDDKAEQPIDSLFETTCKQIYKYRAHTTKVLNFSRIYVEPVSQTTEEQSEVSTEQKTTEDSAQNETGATESLSPLPLNLSMSYEEAIELFPACSVSRASK